MTARKKRTIIEESLPDTGTGSDEEQLSAFDVALESVEDLEALTGIMEQFGQTGQLLKLYRDNGQYCYQSDAIDEAFIQKHFGGGEFRIRVYFNGKYKKTFPVSVSAPMADPNAPSTNGNGSAEHRHMDFLEKLVLAQIAGGSAKGPSITELTGALANLDSLRGKQESAMDLFQKGVTFAREILDMKPSGPSGDWKSDAIGAVKEVFPAVASIFAGKVATPVMPTNPEQPQPIAPGPTTPTPEQQTAMIKQGLEYLKKQCIRGIEPSLIVEWIENNAEDYQPMIHMVLNIPFEEFVKIDAQIGAEPFNKWFTELFDGFRSAFVAVDSMDNDTTGQRGGGNHPGNHGNPSTDAKPKSK